jgi:hypothetical protein
MDLFQKYENILHGSMGQGTIVKEGWLQQVAGYYVLSVCFSLEGFSIT